MRSTFLPQKERVVMKRIDSIFDWILKALIVVAKVLLVAMTLIICVHVFYRYVLNSGIKWSEEVSMLLYVYFGSVSVIYGVRHKLHIGIELFFNLFPKPVQRVCEVISNLVIMACGILLAVNGVALVKSTGTTVMTTTRWPSYLLYIMVPVMGVMIAYFALANLLGYGPKGKEGSGNA